MATPISVPYLAQLIYGQAGYNSRMQLYFPGLANVSSDAFDTISLTTGVSSGTTLTAALTALINVLKGFSSTTTTFQVAELYAYSPTSPHLTPVASKTFAVAGTNGPAPYPATQLSFSMRKGRVRGRFILHDQNYQVPPAIFPPPRFGGSGAFDPIFALWNAQQYFSLRDGSYPDTAFEVSFQYNKKLLKQRALRP